MKGPYFSIHYWRISVTLGSGIAGFNCTIQNSLYLDPGDICPTAPSWASAGGGGGGGGGTGATGGGGGGGAGDVRHPGGARSS